MILILKHDEALNYLASLKTPITETKLSETDKNKQQSQLFLSKDRI